MFISTIQKKNVTSDIRSQHKNQLGYCCTNTQHKTSPITSLASLSRNQSFQTFKQNDGEAQQTCERSWNGVEGQ